MEVPFWFWRCHANAIHHLRHHAEVGMDQDALQWHFALQTYGLPRPDRAGWFVIYRALGRQWGPGMPSFLTIPVGDTTTVQSLLDAIEGGWQDLRLPGQVIPWRVSVIDTFRARSRNRVLESPTMVLIPLVSFADFEQRPHGLLELVFPLGLHTFATVLPSRVNWPIIRSFLAPMMPLGLTLTFVEMWLNDDLLTEELVECHNGFFAHITVTTRDLPLTHYHPAQHAWTPLLHVERSVMQAGLCQYHIHVPGGSALVLVPRSNWWEWQMDGRNGCQLLCSKVPCWGTLMAALFFFLLYAAWVRSRAERPSVSYTKVVMGVAWTGHNLQFTKTN